MKWLRRENDFTFIQTPNLRINGTLTKRNYPNKIILHHPVFYGTPQELNEMEISNVNDPMTMSGYNYYVRKDGSIYAMRPVWARGANCYGQNTQSIGVAAEGNFGVDIMPKAQRDAIVLLCKYLIQQYPGIKEVGPHSKYFSTACPGKNYPITDIINAIYSNVIIKEEEKKVENLVCYSNDIDRRASEYLADKLLCPCINSELPFGYSTVKNVYCVGGPGKLPFTSMAKKIIIGTDRYDTCQKVLDFIKSM